MDAADQSRPPHAAKTIRVTGELHAKTRTIVPDTIEVQDGGDWKPVEMRDAHHGGQSPATLLMNVRVVGRRH